jgi:uncharacterized protein YukJ
MVENAVNYFKTGDIFMQTRKHGVPNYGILKAHPQQSQKGTPGNPHYQILVTDDTNTEYRIAVNVRSEDQSSLLYHIDPDFHYQATGTNSLTPDFVGQLSSLPFGSQELTSEPGGMAIDFLHSDLFPADQIQKLFSVATEDQLNVIFDKLILEAIDEADAGAFICAFGSGWFNPGQEDTIFPFTPSRGIHNIHMNQGNEDKQFIAENGVWQDGALFVYLPYTKKWTAMFLKFQTQAWQTDDQGNAEQ